jgi:ribosome biogenesis protein ERB1
VHVCMQVYKGHKKLIRSLSIDPTGQWFATGSDDKTIKVWEVATGRCMKTLPVSGVVRDVAWNPSVSLCLIAACV